MKLSEIEQGREVIYSRPGGRYSSSRPFLSLVLDIERWYRDAKTKEYVKADKKGRYTDEYGVQRQATKVALAAFNVHNMTWVPVLAHPQSLSPMTERFRERVQEQLDSEREYLLKRIESESQRIKFERKVLTLTGTRLVEDENYTFFQGNEGNTVTFDVAVIIDLFEKAAQK
jgi:hypothetical protein